MKYPKTLLFISNRFRWLSKVPYSSFFLLMYWLMEEACVLSKWHNEIGITVGTCLDVEKYTFCPEYSKASRVVKHYTSLLFLWLLFSTWSCSSWLGQGSGFCVVSEHERKIRRVCKFPKCGRGSRILDGLATCEAAVLAPSGYCFYDTEEKKFYLEKQFELLGDTPILNWFLINLQAVGKHNGASLQFSPTAPVCNFTSFTGQQACVASPPSQKKEKPNQKPKSHKNTLPSCLFFSLRF